jgi:hypothetical protein
MKIISCVSHLIFLGVGVSRLRISVLCTGNKVTWLECL